MRWFAREFITEAAGRLGLEPPVLEVGARPASGQEDLADLRRLVGREPYVGFDIQPGHGVDVVGDVHRLPFPDESFGAVICAEVLEHVHDPLRAVEEVHRVLRPGGIALLTSVMFMPVHEHPWDFWRFTPDGFAHVLRPFETVLSFGYGMDVLPEGVQAVAVKGPMPDLSMQLLPRTADLAARWGENRAVDFGPIRFTVRELWVRTLRETGRAARRRLAGGRR